MSRTNIRTQKRLKFYSIYDLFCLITFALIQILLIDRASLNAHLKVHYTTLGLSLPIYQKTIWNSQAQQNPVQYTLDKLTGSLRIPSKQCGAGVMHWLYPKLSYRENCWEKRCP